MEMMGFEGGTVVPSWLRADMAAFTDQHPSLRWQGSAHRAPLGKEQPSPPH